MTLENKLGISNSLQLANEEEKITKRKALLLFETSFLNGLEAGSFSALTAIHKLLFEDIYDFAGRADTHSKYCQRQLPFCTGAVPFGCT